MSKPSANGPAPGAADDLVGPVPSMGEELAGPERGEIESCTTVILPGDSVDGPLVQA